MADNNLGSADELNDLTNSLGDLTSQLSTNGRNITIADQARQTSIDLLKKEKAAKEAAIAAATDTVRGFYNLGKGLQTASSGKDGFDSLNKAISIAAKLMSGAAQLIPIPYVGDVVGGVIEGAAEVTKFMIGQFSKAYGNFEKLAATGVISTFDELKEASSSIGLTFSDTEKVLSKYSQSLSTFAGTASLGRKRFQDIAFETKEIGESFQIIGISASDFADMQLTYITKQTKISGGKYLTDQQLIEGSIEFTEKIDTLSKLTGISRKELQEQILETTRQTRYMAGIATLDKKVVDNIDLLLPMLSVLDKDFGEGVTDAIASGATGTSEKEKKALFALRAGGMDVVNEIKELRRTGNYEAFYAKVRKSLSVYNKELTSLVKVSDKNSLVSGAYVASANVLDKTDTELLKIRQDIDEERRKKLAATTGEDPTLARTKRALYGTTRNVELLATGSKTMTTIMDKMASGIEYITEKLYEAVGDEGIPDFLKYRKAERIEIQKKIDMQKDLEKDLANQERLMKQQADIEKNPDNPQNKKIKLKNKRALETIKLQIESNELLIKEQEEKIKVATANKIKADKDAGFGPTVGAGPLTSAASTSAAPPTPGAASGAAPATSGAAPATSEAAGVTPESGTISSSSGESNRGIVAIRELISSVESVGGDYNSLFGGSTSTPLTTMTLAQVIQHQRKMVAGGARSSAAGRYQFMPDSLAEYAAKLKLDLNSAVFNPATQDALADVLIREKGYESFKSGKITATQFLNNLSRAWAGLPSPEKGGRSFYAKDGLNRSHMSTESALARIGQAKTGGIFSGPSTGYLAMLHGDEMIIPANDGSSRLQFDGVTGGAQSDDMVQSILLMMSKKVDKMIGLTQREISVQRRIAISGIK